jgi:glycosyltransferase involved in cell wall biosynthesis
MTSRGSRLRVLVFSSLYPSASRPRHGIFVETRLRQLLTTGDIDARVVAPVPWFPAQHRIFGVYGEWAATPEREERYGVTILHPRYAMVPRLGAIGQPYAMALAGLRAIRALAREGFECDVIDAHYFYPDGVAAAMLGRWIGRPFVVTARGSDLNVIANGRFARSRIVATGRRAHRVLCVSEALRRRAIDIGLSADHVDVAPNGVDTDFFVVRDRADSRGRLRIADRPGPVMLCVGNLVPEKGHEMAIAALSLLKSGLLVIVGDGPLRRGLEDRARRLGVLDRIVFLHAMPQDALVDAYNAADVLVHPSLREGWPNVVLEAMACGVPVVATEAGGVREMIDDGRTGEIVSSRSPKVLAEAIERLLEKLPQRQDLRRHAATFAWSGVVGQCMRVLSAAAATRSIRETRSRPCAT